MQNILRFLFIPLVVSCGACSSSKQSVIPLQHALSVEDTYTIIWNGYSEAYRYTDGKWQRDEAYDYTFDVIQKRYDTVWKSVKNMHRIHPDYDGKAGDRDQTMYFELAFHTLHGNEVFSNVNSSLGAGTGFSDTSFRRQELTLSLKDPSAFIPYNKFRIKQSYQYEEGLLIETVELLKEKDGVQVPFMMNKEKAYIYTRTKLEEAPTVYKP